MGNPLAPVTRSSIKGTVAGDCLVARRRAAGHAARWSQTPPVLTTGGIRRRFGAWSTGSVCARTAAPAAALAASVSVTARRAHGDSTAGSTGSVRPLCARAALGLRSLCTSCRQLCGARVTFGICRKTWVTGCSAPATSHPRRKLPTCSGTTAVRTATQVLPCNLPSCTLTSLTLSPPAPAVLPALRWIQQALPFWNASVDAGVARHVMVTAHEEGWAEVWRYLVEWLRDLPGGDHPNDSGLWDQIHPASPTRQLAVLQFSGNSDYTPPGMPRRHRCVSQRAACYVCFQPGKDVVVPAAPGLVDYPDAATCRKLKRTAA
eukprot:5537520-Prymnesium_polylepis.1